MDRNFFALNGKNVHSVALRKESVDRNDTAIPRYAGVTVALRKESVDRNSFCKLQVVDRLLVALRKESVDRNVVLVQVGGSSPRSLSARRAWIEICVRLGSLVWALGRSPQGERG